VPVSPRTLYGTFEAMLATLAAPLRKGASSADLVQHAARASAHAGAGRVPRSPFSWLQMAGRYRTMSLFSPTKGPVTIRSVEKTSSFEVLHAFQADRPVGAIRFDWTPQGAGMQTVVGHGHAGYVAPFVRHAESIAAYNGRLVWFTDFWEMSTYDSPMRTGQGDWIARNRAKIDSGHILVQSKIVAMGASVVNLAVGGFIKFFAKRPDFDALVSQHGLPARRPVLQ